MWAEYEEVVKQIGFNKHLIDSCAMKKIYAMKIPEVVLWAVIKVSNTSLRKNYDVSMFSPQANMNLSYK